MPPRRGFQGGDWCRFPCLASLLPQLAWVLIDRKFRDGVPGQIADTRAALCIPVQHHAAMGRDEMAMAAIGHFHHSTELAADLRRNLAGEIGEEWEARSGKGEAVDDLLALVKQIVPYHMGHNAETDAVDLLLEVSVWHYALHLG